MLRKHLDSVAHGIGNGFLGIVFGKSLGVAGSSWNYWSKDVSLEDSQSKMPRCPRDPTDMQGKSPKHSQPTPLLL